MPEGPSIVLFAEEMQRFTGQKVVEIGGNSKIEKERLVGKKIKEIRTWGKHLLLVFDKFTLRIHFLMFGSYRINEVKDAAPRLHLKCSKDELNFYSTAIKMIEEPLDEVYDWPADVLSKNWDPKAAKKKLQAKPETMVTDALL